MTALEAVATYLPDERVPIEDLADQLDLTPMQVKVFRRYHKLGEVRLERDGTVLDLLLAAVDNLHALRGREHQVRYVVYARTFPMVVPYPVNPLHELCRLRGLGHASAFTVTHHACASGLLALDIAGRLLAGDADGDAEEDALALVLAGEKAFTLESQLVPETSIFGEGASACLVRAGGSRDRMLSYASNIRGEFDGELADVAARFQREHASSLADAITAAVDEAGLRFDEVSLILPHNVNVVAWQRVCRRIGYPVSRVLLDNVPVTGHVFCADAFFNYQTARQRDMLHPGDRYVVAAAGSGRGATFSAMVFEH
ncbi:MAG: 3-oxoacyl-ACP synthase [Actinobacteria bacterium 13_2_20CM_2_71_6]|nr:MAG: 3-oxoacyl-ACP synthase [Actinobacteria bacterium 13_2_20CM_2_71_6]